MQKISESVLVQEWISGMLVFFGTTVIVFFWNKLFFKKTIFTKSESNKDTLIGTSLSSMVDIYPIRVNKNNEIYLDKNYFLNAIDILIYKKNYKAAVDLVYLGDLNLDKLKLTRKENRKYNKLKRKYKKAIKYVGEISNRRTLLFERYQKIVIGFGETFNNTPIEVVLHDVRNPLHAIVFIANPLTGRVVGDPLTNFGIELIKNYGRFNRVDNTVGYLIKTSKGGKFKSTTIPLIEEPFGLVGFMCINIDINAFNATGIMDNFLKTPYGELDEQILSDE